MEKRTLKEVSEDIDKMFAIGGNSHNKRTDGYEYTVSTEKETPAEIATKLFDYFATEYEDIETGVETYQGFGVKCTITPSGGDSVKFSLSEV